MSTATQGTGQNSAPGTEQNATQQTAGTEGSQKQGPEGIVQPGTEGAVQAAPQPAPALPARPPIEEVTEMFFINGLSFAGRDHIHGEYKGNGNQDCFGRRVTERGVILVSCDGCGSTPDSSTGSRAAVRIILNAAEEILFAQDVIPSPTEFTARLQEDLLKRIYAAAIPLAGNGDIDSILYASYLFTVLVGVITPDWTAVIGCGDGFFQVNGDSIKVSPREGNKPEYLVYRIFKDPHPDFVDVKLEVYRVVDTLSFKSVLVATDGMEALIESEEDLGFTFKDLWTDDRFRISQVVADEFARLSEDSQKLEVTKRNFSVTTELIPYTGIFSDDTTFVQAVREPKADFPKTWNDYRKARGLKFIDEKPAPKAKAAQTAPAGTKPAGQAAPGKAGETAKPGKAVESDPSKTGQVQKKGESLWDRFWKGLVNFFSPLTREIPKKPKDEKIDKKKRKD